MWRKYRDGYLKQRCGRFLLVIPVEPNSVHGGHFWEARDKGIVYRIEKSPTIDDAKHQAILWAWRNQ